MNEFSVGQMVEVNPSTVCWYMSPIDFSKPMHLVISDVSPAGRQTLSDFPTDHKNKWNGIEPMFLIRAEDRRGRMWTFVTFANSSISVFADDF